MSCPSYINTKPVPVCCDTLTIGTITALNTDVKVYITKANGARIVQETTSSAAGLVTLDMTDPESEFYNEYDGIYLVSIGTDLNNLYTITIGSETNTVVGFKVNNYKGNDTTTFTLEAA